MARYSNFESALEGFERELHRSVKIHDFNYTLDSKSYEGLARLIVYRNGYPKPFEYTINYDAIKTYTNIRNTILAIFDHMHGIDSNRSILPKIEKVIFNDPATIVIWSDDSKTVVKCCEDDTFDPEKGLAMAISKKALGDLKEVKKWANTYEEPEFIFDVKLPTPKFSTKELVDAFDRIVRRRRGEVNDV